MRVKLLSLLLVLAVQPSLALAQSQPARDAVADPAAHPQQDASQEVSQDAAQDEDPDAMNTASAKVPLDEIRRYVTVYNAIKQAYVDPVDDHKLMQSAVRGLLLDLDPHSAYLEKAEAEDFDEQTRGTYDGVGVQLQQLPDGALRVVAPLDDSPAEKAGLRSGDRIIGIDGKLLGKGQADASAPLRGKAGSKVVVKVVRQGVKAPFDLTLVRDTIRAASVRSKLLEPGFG